MKIYFDNCNFSSNSGPNSFAVKLAKSLLEKGHVINEDAIPDVQISFVFVNNILAPVIQRLDGIYFNSQQDWQSLNRPIQETFIGSKGVIYQSEFNKQLTEEYFGEKENYAIIRNGTDLEAINSVEVLQQPELENFDNVWSCASSWRPHKRLSENVRYFLEHSSGDDCLIIAGENADHLIKHERIFYVGNLSWPQLISLYKRSKYFVHLALMDHCPNVVVDARAAGCKIVCSDSGGTQEIAGPDATIIKDMEWDFKPFKLYEPGQLDFTNIVPAKFDIEIDINTTADKYVSFFEKSLK